MSRDPYPANIIYIYYLSLFIIPSRDRPAAQDDTVLYNRRTRYQRIYPLARLSTLGYQTSGSLPETIDSLHHPFIHSLSPTNNPRSHRHPFCSILDTFQPPQPPQPHYSTITLNHCPPLSTACASLSLNNSPNYPHSLFHASFSPPSP